MLTSARGRGYVRTLDKGVHCDGPLEESGIAAGAETLAERELGLGARRTWRQVADALADKTGQRLCPRQIVNIHNAAIEKLRVLLEADYGPEGDRGFGEEDYI